MTTKSKLARRDLQAVAIKDIMALYSEESIQEVLNIQPELRNIDFVTELQKHDYKQEVIDRIKKRERQERQAIKMEMSRRVGGKIHVVEPDSETEDEDDCLPF